MNRLWLLLALLLACSEDVEPATQVLVVVESDLALGSELSRLQVSVQSEAGRPVSEPFPLALSSVQAAGKLTLPLSFGVYWQGADRVRVVVTGYGPLGPSGSEVEVVEQKALVTFQRGQTLRMTVFLGQVCLRKLCSDEQVCYPRAVSSVGVGDCGALPTATTERVKPGDELQEPASTLTHDARAADARTPDAGQVEPDAEEIERDAAVLEDARVSEDVRTPDARVEDASMPSGNDAGMAGCPVGAVGTSCRPTTRRLAATDGACVIRKDGTVWCWNSAFNADARPHQVPGLDDAVEVASGGSNGCARRAEGSVVCWGINVSGQLGDGTFTSSATPVVVKGLRDVKQIDARLQRTCAIDGAGKVWCWGQNAKCTLGICDDNANLPVQVQGVADVVDISLGFDHACAVQRDGTVYCWGNQRGGALGNNVDGDWGIATATRVLGLGGASHVISGTGYSCTTGTSGLSCWGYGTYYFNNALVQDIASYTPFTVMTPAALRSLAAGEAHQCALTASGAVCRGSNTSGQLGDNTFHPGWVAKTPDNTFVNVVDSSKFVEISAYAHGTCALTSDERVLCWGEVSPNVDKTAPTEVQFL